MANGSQQKGGVSFGIGSACGIDNVNNPPLESLYPLYREKLLKGVYTQSHCITVSSLNPWEPTIETSQFYADLPQRPQANIS